LFEFDLSATEQAQQKQIDALAYNAKQSIDYGQFEDAIKILQKAQQATWDMFADDP
jgi:Flp pilus assembly protein TadD